MAVVMIYLRRVAYDAIVSRRAVVAGYLHHPAGHHSWPLRRKR